MSQKNILFLAQLPPPIHGVSMMSKQVFDIIENLEEGGDLDYLWSGGAKNFKDINKKSFGKIFSFAKLIWTLLYRFMRGKRYEIAYLTFAPWTHAALRDGLIAWFAGLSANRVLLHLHGEGLQAVIDQKSFKDKLLARLVRNTDLIAITASSVTLAKQSALFSKVHFLPNFVNAPPQDNTPSQSNAVSQGFEKKNDTKPRPLKIAFLGNLDPRKGVFRFLDFLQVMDQAGILVEGEIVGAPTQFLRIEDVIAQAKNRKIEHILSVPGAKYDQDKIDFLYEADIFLYPTTHDYAPLVLIEALSLHTVPIVYDTGGIAEMVGETFQDHVIDPNLAPEKQNKMIANLVKNYSDNLDLLEKDKGKAFKVYLNHYTKQAFTLKLMTIFEK